MLIGLVGKPSVGKSTIFKALTMAEVEIAPYPFTTIKPNRGFGYIRIDCIDKEFGMQCTPRVGYCKNGIRFVPVELLDVPGLIEGAHEGQGMGNQFLDSLRMADCFVHVVDISGSTDIKGNPSKAGTNDPGNDIRMLDRELDMWYFGILEKNWEKFVRSVKASKIHPAREIAKQFSGIGVKEEDVKEIMKNLILEEDLTKWNEERLKLFARQLRINTKPMIIAANKVDVPGALEILERVSNEFPEYSFISCSAESELALKEAAKKNLIDYVPGSKTFKIIDESKLNEQQLKALKFIHNILERFGSTGCEEIINTAVFKLLKYKAVFPGGEKMMDSEGRIMPDCFLLPEKTTALDFAYKLHTDLGKGFIKAIDIRTKKTIAKDQILENRSVVQIVSSK